MGPIKVIVSALATGAAARLKPPANKAIQHDIENSYTDIKAWIQWKYHVSVEALEKNPYSKAQQALLVQELGEVGADMDNDLSKAAEFLLWVAEGRPSGLGGGPRAGADVVTLQGVRDGENFAVVRVLYATDRAQITNAKPAEVFGNSRGTLSFGYCDVSIPHDHRMGELESSSILRFQFYDDPAKHVVLLRTVITSKEEFFGGLAAYVRSSHYHESAFLFVHGYNVTFEDAARRTAQISYDLAFDGAPVFYSWPSQGTAGAYTVDEQNIEWAQANLKVFLEEFFTRSEARNVYLIAHSMGNRALTRAVASLMADKPALRSRLTEVILTAPDIDADVFKRDIAPALVASGRPVTLYASSGDLALVASKKIHGYARAGDTGRGLIVAQGVETIDATNVDTNLMGHSYFAENRSVLSDMFYLIRDGKRPDMRFGLRRIDMQAGCYWEFKQ